MWERVDNLQAKQSGTQKAPAVCRQVQALVMCKHSAFRGDINTSIVPSRFSNIREQKSKGV